MKQAFFQRLWNSLIWRSTNLEDPLTTINGYSLIDIFGGSATNAGETVSEKTAMTFSAVWRSTQIISGIIGALPFKIYRNTDSGREEAKDHPYWEVITKSPNSTQTKAVFWQRAINHYLNWGNFFAEIKRNVVPVIELIHPARFRKIEKNTRGNLVFVFDWDQGIERRIRQDNLIHVPNLGDEIIGKGIIAQAREDIGLEFARQKYGSQYFKDGGKTKAFISTDQILKADQRKDLAEWIRTQKQAGHDLILDSGFKYAATSIPPEDSQFLGTGDFSVATIARWYGVPKSKLAHSEDPTFANIENMGIEFLTDTISPIISKIEDEFDAKLFDKEYCEFDMNAYLRGDMKSKAEYYTKMVNAGLMTINEVRRKENLNKIESGDRPIVQGAMTFLDKLGTQPAKNA